MENSFIKAAFYLSDYLNVPASELDKLGILDGHLERDSAYYLNIENIKDTKIPEFKNGYQNIVKVFDDICLLLSHSNNASDVIYAQAQKNFEFHEVDELGIGFAKGKGHGNGFGKQNRDVVIDRAFQIVKAGTSNPELFFLLPLFVDGIGPDHLCDMFATILKPMFKAFTKRVIKEMANTPGFNCACLDGDGIPLKPLRKNKNIYFVPKDLLSELPVAKDWSDISSVCSANMQIKSLVNSIISIEWNKLSTSQLKEAMFKALTNKEDASFILGEYKQAQGEDCHQNIPSADDERKQEIGEFYSSLKIDETKCTFEIAKEFFEYFKNIIENNGIGKTLIRLTETEIQDVIMVGLKMFVKNSYNVDPSKEANAGRGPVDFKISRGTDKTVVEIKLSSNKNCIAGIEVQIEEYAKAEETANKVFVLFDNGEKEAIIDQTKDKVQEMTAAKKNPSFLIVIDLKPKASASKFQPSKPLNT